jgi:ketosteroid isomerase-like protein
VAGAQPRLTARALAGAGLLALALAAGCGRTDPERELRDTIATMAQSVEQRDPAVLLDAVAEDFTRETGAFGKQDVRRTVLAAYVRNEKIRVSAVVTDVRVEGDRAFARVRVLATGGAGLLPERGRAWDFDSAWRRDGGRWKVFNAEWREGP